VRLANKTSKLRTATTSFCSVSDPYEYRASHRAVDNRNLESTSATNCNCRKTTLAYNLYGCNLNEDIMRIGFDEKPTAINLLNRKKAARSQQYKAIRPVVR